MKAREERNEKRKKSGKRENTAIILRRKDANRLKKIIAKNESENLSTSADITLPDYCDRAYELYKKPKVKESTQILYLGIMKTIRTSEVLNVPIKSLDTRTLQMYFNNISNNYSQGSLKGIKIKLNWFFKKAVDEKIIESNPMDGVELPRGNDAITSKKVRLSLDEVQKLKAYMENEEIEIRLKAIVLLALNTGMRVGEITGLMEENIDLDEQFLNVETGISRDINSRFILSTPKTIASYRRIPLTSSVVPVLKEWIEEKKRLKAKAGAKWNENKLFFTNNHGDILVHQILNEKLKKVYKKLNIKNATFHTLRHTFASLMVEMNQHPKIASEILGHDINTMLKIYAKIGDREKEKTISDLDNFLTEL